MIIKYGHTQQQKIRSFFLLKVSTNYESQCCFGSYIKKEKLNSQISNHFYTVLEIPCLSQYMLFLICQFEVVDSDSVCGDSNGSVCVYLFKFNLFGLSLIYILNKSKKIMNSQQIQFSI